MRTAALEGRALFIPKVAHRVHTLEVTAHPIFAH